MLSTTQVSRRQLLKVSLGSALGVGLAASGLSLPTSEGAKASAASLPFEAYHGVTGATHQARFNDLAARGFRPISLSIYGDPADARYAAVWVQRPGAGFRMVHGVTASGYQAVFDAAVADGMVPVLVSATGSSTGPVETARFAAVFEHGIAGGWKARHGLVSGDSHTAGTIENEYRLAYENKLYMRSVAVYGNAGSRRYAAIWHANTGTFGNLFQPALSPNNYQQLFNDLTQTSLRYRPAYLGVTADGAITSVFRSDANGAWIARHNLTSEQYQQAFNEATAQGFIPLCVQGGGIGAYTRYAAIFATNV